jgi:hypothetical protein
VYAPSTSGFAAKCELTATQNLTYSARQTVKKGKKAPTQAQTVKKGKASTNTSSNCQVRKGTPNDKGTQRWPTQQLKLSRKAKDDKATQHGPTQQLKLSRKAKQGTTAFDHAAA